MQASNGIRNATAPGTMNGAENGPLNLTGKQMGSPWAPMPSTNKPGQPGLGHHMHPNQSHQTMPLSPPLTPLPPNSARFPPSMVLPPQSSFNPAANLHQLLLAAQCNPFLKNPAVPAMSPFPMSPEVMENVQKILQLRQQQQQLLNPELQKSDKESSDWVETDDENDTNNKPVSVESSPLSNSHNNNNSNKSTFVERSSKSDEELKREEEMLEDEMKEEEDDTSEDEKKQLDLADSLRAVLMKKFLEDFTNKSAAGVKEMMSNPLSLANSLSQDGRPLFQAGEIPCKFNCGKMFTSMMDLFQHQDGNCTKMLSRDDNDRDNVVTDDDMLSENGDQDSQDDLNTSGNNSSAGGERKVRVRTLISDEQLVVLRAFYMINPRPKREELEKVAAKIGHPFKVVKVWFQNSRARDRREGKPMSNQSNILGGHPSPSQTHSSSANAPTQSSFPAFPFLNNNFPQASNAALMTAAASLLQNTRGLPFINPNSPLFAGANLEQPFDTSNKDKNDIVVDDVHHGSSDEGEKGGSTIEEGSEDEFQNSRNNDSPRILNNHYEPRPSLISERRSSSKLSAIEGERKKTSSLTSNTAQQPLDLSNKGLSSSSSSPSNSPLSASMKDTDDKEEKGEETEGEVILNLSSKGSNGASSFTSSSSPITKTAHTSSIEDATVMQVEKITTSRPLSQPISSIPSELPTNNQPSPQSTGKSPFLNLSAQGSAGFTTSQTSSTLLGLYAKQSSNLPIDVYRFGGEEVCFDNDTSTSSAGKGGGEKFDEEGNYSCEKCNKTFTKRSSLSRHRYEHSGKR